MNIELGTYKAYKDTAMTAGVSCWLMLEGEELQITQIDKENKKVLFKCGRDTDWMGFDRIKKCFVRVGE